MTGTTRQSRWIEGDGGNYLWRVMFTFTTDDYLGIHQSDLRGVIEGVVLAPDQVHALRAFLGRRTTATGRKTTATRKPGRRARGAG